LSGQNGEGSIPFTPALGP